MAGPPSVWRAVAGVHHHRNRKRPASLSVGIQHSYDHQAHGCVRSGAARWDRRGRGMNVTDWRVPPALWPPTTTPSPSTPISSISPSVPYVVSEVLVGAAAVVGNAAVLVAFVRERRLRRRTNYYIVSLAAADLLVGALGVPFAVMASLGLPSGNLHACLFTVSLLVVLCTTSIFCLVAVSVDRYWAILHPLGYSRIVSTRMAIGIIALCWVAGSFVGFLPLLGWYRTDADKARKCFFTQVMDYNYLVFLYFFTIVFPAVLLVAFYAHIYTVVLAQLQKIAHQNPTPLRLRVLGPARKREVKVTQNLAIIVLFFAICWLPLYTINCVQAFCPQCVVPSSVTSGCIILSHLNSAGNPLLYAYHLKDFRAALKHLLFGTSSATFNDEVHTNPGGGGGAAMVAAATLTPAGAPRMISTGTGTVNGVFATGLTVESGDIHSRTPTLLLRNSDNGKTRIISAPAL